MQVININPDSNTVALSRSKSLSGYSALIAKIREFKRAGEKQDMAVKRAVDYCISNDILKEFLKNNLERVLELLNTEFNLDLMIQAKAEEAAEEAAEAATIAATDKKAKEMAKKMLAKNEPIEKIIEFTELTEEVIETLKTELTGK